VSAMLVDAYTGVESLVSLRIIYGPALSGYPSKPEGAV